MKKGINYGMFEELPNDYLMVMVDGGQYDGSGRELDVIGKITAIYTNLELKVTSIVSNVTGSTVLAEKAAEKVIDKVFGDLSSLFN